MSSRQAAGAARQLPCPAMAPTRATHTLSPRTQYTPGFWMTCTPLWGRAGEGRETTLPCGLHAYPCVLRTARVSRVPACALNSHTPGAEWAVARGGAAVRSRPLGEPGSPCRPPAVAHTVRAAHLCRVHALLALLEEDVGSLVVAAQDALQGGPKPRGVASWRVAVRAGLPEAQWPAATAQAAHGQQPWQLRDTAGSAAAAAAGLLGAGAVGAESSPQNVSRHW
jgi:hypothetical protein